MLHCVHLILYSTYDRLPAARLFCSVLFNVYRPGSSRPSAAFYDELASALELLVVFSRYSSSGRQPNFAAFNRGRHLIYSSRRPSLGIRIGPHSSLYLSVVRYVGISDLHQTLLRLSAVIGAAAAAAKAPPPVIFVRVHGRVEARLRLSTILQRIKYCNSCINKSF